MTLIAFQEQKDSHRESEIYYRTLLNSMFEDIIVIDRNYRIVDVNNTYLVSSGHGRDQVIGRYCYELSHGYNEPCDKHGKDCKLAQVFETGETHNCRHEHLASDGSKVLVEILLSPLKDKNGKITHVIESVRDISHRKEAEDALKESEEKYRKVLEANPDPVIVYDIEGKVIYFNPAFERVFGWSLEDRLGKKMDLFVPDENWPETRMMIDKVLAGESFSGIETHRFDKQGKTIPVSISGACYRDRNGNHKCIIANFRDISEQKKLQAQLQQAQKMEAIGTLAGGIAHDFNNILFPIMGYTEMTLEDVPPDSKAANNLSEILRATHRAKELIQQILTFSRQSDNKRNPLRIQPIIKEALRLLRSSLPATINIHQNIGKECGPVMANPTQVHQVLMNLCTNAYHAMREKGGLLEVTLTEKEIGSDDLGFYSDMVPGHYLLLTVSDTGHGINKAVMERIFEPYFTLKEPGEGSGMGLSTVHGIIKSHNGHIRVYSEPGKGTAFHIYLPRIATDTTALKSSSAGPLPTGHEHILLVDDEQQIVQMEKQQLERLGYQVTARTSSIEALKAFQANRDKFDLVITDMTMPNLTGDKLAQKLMEIRSDIPTILCTGFSEKISQERADALGIKGFLMKPVVMRDLAQKIREVLDG